MDSCASISRRHSTSPPSRPSNSAERKTGSTTVRASPSATGPHMRYSSTPRPESWLRLVVEISTYQNYFDKERDLCGMGPLLPVVDSYPLPVVAFFFYIFLQNIARTP